MDLPPDEQQDDTLETPGAKPGSPLADLLSDLLGSEEEPPDGPATGCSDPTDLESDPQPPPPAPDDFPEPIVLDDLLDSLISDPRQDAAPRLETIARESIELESTDLEEMELAPNELGWIDLPAEPASTDLVWTELELTELTSAQQSTAPSALPEPGAEEPGHADAEAAGVAEPLAATETVVDVETEPSPGEQRGPSVLDGLVAEIDAQTGDAFRDLREFGFEGELPAREARGGDSCIIFVLHGTRYAIPIRNVLEMDTMPKVTFVPNVPEFVRGVTNVRGEIIAVLDLRSLFGLERWEFAERGRILIVHTTDQQIAALAVDEVRGTAALSLDALGAPAGPIHDKVMPVLLGVGEHQNQVLNVLDVDRMFRMQEIQQFTAN